MVEKIINPKIKVNVELTQIAKTKYFLSKIKRHFLTSFVITTTCLRFIDYISKNDVKIKYTRVAIVSSSCRQELKYNYFMLLLYR